MGNIPDYNESISSTFSLLNSSTQLSASLSQSLSDSLSIPILNQPIRTNLDGDPYSGVVYLAIGFDTNQNGQTDEYAKATGFLIYPNVIVTAAHNILNGVTNDDIIEVRVYPECDDNIRPENTSQDFIYPQTWWFSSSYQGYTQQNDAYNHDWAVILLQENITDTYLFNCSTISSSASELSGYLEMIGYCGNNNAYQYSSTGWLGSLEERYFTVSMPILPGHSGSPLTNKSTHTCYGIATASSGDYMLNICTRITTAVFDTICYVIENFA